MSCDLITKVEAFYAAYNALIARCCTGLTPIAPSSCVWPSILAAYTAARSLLTSTPSTCKKLTASPGAPDPGSPPACLTATWLDGCASWLTSITCIDESTGEICDIDLNGAGGIEGFDQTYSATSGTLHIEFEAYSVPDQLILTGDTGELLNTGMMSGHLSQDLVVPSGTTSIRVQVIGSSSGTAWTLRIYCLTTP